MASFSYLGEFKHGHKYRFYWNDPILKDKKGSKKRHSEIHYLDKKSDYLAKLEYFEQKEKENPDDKTNQLFSFVADEWYEKFAKNHYKDISGHLSTLKFIKPYFENWKIKDIKATDVNTFHDSIRNSRRDSLSGKKTVSESTVKNYYHTLNSIFKYASEHGYVTHNIMTTVKKIVVKHEPVAEKSEVDRDNFWKTIFKYLNYEINEAQKDYENKPTNYFKDVYFQKEQFKLIIMLTFSTGLRASEVIALRWIDVQVDEHGSSYFNIKYQLKNRKLEETKSKKSRNIGITDDLAMKINEHKLRSQYRNNEFIFTTIARGSKEVTPFGDGSVSQTWKRFLERTANSIDKETDKNNSIEIQRFHDIRHDYATNLFLHLEENDIELRSEVVREVLGHSNAQFTRNQYIHYEKKTVINKKTVDAQSKYIERLGFDLS